MSFTLTWWQQLRCTLKWNNEHLTDNADLYITQIKGAVCIFLIMVHVLHIKKLTAFLKNVSVL